MPGWRAPGADGEGGGVEHLAAVADAGAIGDGFDREGFVVRRVEGELPGGPVGGPKGVRAQGDAANSGALEAREAYTAYAARARSMVCWVASGSVRLRRVPLESA